MEWKGEVDSLDTESVEQKANNIGLSNRIDTAIQLLQICDAHDISVNQAKAIDVVPNIVTSCYQPYIRIVDDRETHDPSGWTDLVFPDGCIRILSGGEIIMGAQTVRPDT